MIFEKNINEIASLNINEKNILKKNNISIIFDFIFKLPESIESFVYVENYSTFEKIFFNQNIQINNNWIFECEYITCNRVGENKKFVLIKIKIFEQIITLFEYSLSRNYITFKNTIEKNNNKIFLIKINTKGLNNRKTLNSFGSNWEIFDLNEKNKCIQRKYSKKINISNDIIKKLIDFISIYENKLAEILYIIHLSKIHSKNIIENNMKIIMFFKLAILCSKKDNTFIIEKNKIIESIEFVKNKINIEPTQEQNDIIYKMTNDILNKKNCLLTGETGSGKTFVVLAMIHFFYNSNMKFHIGFILPTRTLYEQTLNLCKKIFPIDYLENPENKKNFLYVNTQKIFYQKKELDLLIIDEEQKLGVVMKTFTKGVTLKISATPVPRTLKEVFLGNLSHYEIKEIWHKKTVTTDVIYFDKNKLLEILLNLINEKTVIICSFIEHNDFSVNNIYNLLKDHFKNIDYLHGKLNPIEQSIIINKLRTKTEYLCISTSILEMGIDIPDIKNLIVLQPIFGLASLHQMRGRVARKIKEGKFTILIDKEKQINIKVRFLEKINLGKNLSIIDRQIRGWGDLETIKQSGKSKEFACLSEEELDFFRDLLDKLPEKQNFINLKKFFLL